MSSSSTPVLAATALFAGAFGLIWASNGTGIIRADHDRHVDIPGTLTVPLQVRAAYNGEKIFFQYRWPAERPRIFHDVLRYQGGEWRRYGDPVPGPNPHGLHEDRVAMLVDDGSVPEFGRYGGYVAIGAGLAELSTQAGAEEVGAHPRLGKELKEEAVTKYLPATRTIPADWTTTVDGERMATLRKSGYFLDLWHWRANRGAPIGVADDQAVHEIRGGDAGRSAWSTNWDGERKQPRWMFDPEKAGHAALRWEEVEGGAVAQDSVYYLHAGTMIPYDADHPWQEGDTLPRRALRDPTGSRADIGASGRWADGHWTVTLSRALDTGNPLDDKIFHDGGSYSVAFAIHRHATGGRWHYVSLPLSLGLSREAELQAVRFAGDAPPWQQEWKAVKLFYPGQVTWPLLTSEEHAGSAQIRRGVPVKRYHTEEQLASYGVEMEFRERIVGQWRLTLLAGLLLFAAAGFALVRAPRN
ncbi:ethylbenzene dehydrogenase-related protein [Pseudothauera rhizosphaerae]|uniref:Cytochrome c-552/DMSO reductase-like haem-binding domain-containing protein n=1 Tax=Pseudothauera rhizosphaerae TaxID=2565932 RepID=A0A4S4AN56_9RHOO|nr:ethylbenzene dehydrogenase-related protein [Pseudothauera rhizosphaerae]THF61025.1 hypothetical protein E6O51_12440 [Pseudothauera rhizosphaerae]